MTRRETEPSQRRLKDDVSDAGACFACLGRHVTHCCGRRLIPEDTDALLREEEERKKKDEEEEKKRKLEKKKAADLKRKESLKRHKEEREQGEREKQEWLEALRREEQYMMHNEEDEETKTSQAETLSNLEGMAAADLVGLKTGRPPEQSTNEVDISTRSTGSQQLQGQAYNFREHAEPIRVGKTSSIPYNNHTQRTYVHTDSVGTPANWNSGVLGKTVVAPKYGEPRPFYYDGRHVPHQKPSAHPYPTQSLPPCGSGGHQLQQHLEQTYYLPQSHSNFYSACTPPYHPPLQSYEMFRPSQSRLEPALSTSSQGQIQQHPHSYDLFIPPQTRLELSDAPSTLNSSQGPMQQRPHGFAINRPTQSTASGHADQGHWYQSPSCYTPHPASPVGGAIYDPNATQPMFSFSNMNVIDSVSAPQDALVPNGHPRSNPYTNAPQSLTFTNAAAPCLPSNSEIPENIGAP